MHLRRWTVVAEEAPIEQTAAMARYVSNSVGSATPIRRAIIARFASRRRRGLWHKVDGMRVLHLPRAA